MLLLALLALQAKQPGFEIARVLARGGRAVLMAGDGVVGDRAEDAVAATSSAVEGTGMRLVAWASQAHPVMDRRLAAIFGGRPRKEHLMLLVR